jgi:hypothetical protein
MGRIENTESMFKNAMGLLEEVYPILKMINDINPDILGNREDQILEELTLFLEDWEPKKQPTGQEYKPGERFI